MSVKFDQCPPDKLLRRVEAAKYVQEMYAFPVSVQWLAKLVTTGGGPVFVKAGRYPLYRVSDLDAWAQSRLSKPMRATGIPAGEKS